MGFLDDVADTLASAAYEVRDWANDVKDSAKLQVEYKEKERLIKENYEELGKKFYEEHKDDADNEAINAINEALKRMEAIKEEMDEIKGTVDCPSCGAKNANDSVYCCKCGKELAPEEKAEKVDAEVVDDETEQSADTKDD